MVSTRRGAAKRPATSSSAGTPAPSNKRRKAAAAGSEQADAEAPSTAAEPAAVTSPPENVANSPPAEPSTTSPADIDNNEVRTPPPAICAESVYDPIKGKGTLAVLLKIQKQAISSMQPWGKLISQYSQHPHVPLTGCTFTIGRSRSCMLQLKDQSISATLCRLKYSQHDGGAVSVLLESTGSNGVVQVNGKTLKKNTIITLKGGDELVFVSAKHYSFIFQQCPTVQQTAASSALQTAAAAYTDRCNARAIAAAADAIFPDDTAISNMALSVGKRQALKDEFLRGIVEGRDTEVSFEEFPYYLSESTKSLLVTSTFVHLKRSNYAKYAAELPAISPRILLTGPSEIYQETLVKALAYHYEAKLLIFDSSSMPNEAQTENAVSKRLPAEALKLQDKTLDGNDDLSWLPTAVEIQADSFPEDLPPNDYLESRASPVKGVPSLAVPGDASDCTRSASAAPQQASLLQPTGTPGGSASTSVKRLLKKGDRVKFIGPSNASGALASSLHGYFCRCVNDFYFDHPCLDVLLVQIHPVIYQVPKNSPDSSARQILIRLHEVNNHVEAFAHDDWVSKVVTTFRPVALEICSEAWVDDGCD